jgi:hypothetical protein
VSTSSGVLCLLDDSTAPLTFQRRQDVQQSSVCPQGKRAEALEGLLNLEKQHRLGEDATATKAACAAILEVLFEAKDWKALNEHILLLAKRRSQLKQARPGPAWATPQQPGGARTSAA